MKKSFAVLTFLLLLSPSIAFADLGPKPTMDFVFPNMPNGVTIIDTDSQLLSCKDRFCLSSTPLENYGPQGFGCGAKDCSALAYGFSEYSKLTIHFTDKQRTSNVFRSNGDLNQTYTVSINGDSLSIANGDASGTPATTKTNPGQFPMNSFLLAFLATIMLEIFVAAIYFSIRKLPQSLLLLVLGANIVSIPVFWTLDYVNQFSASSYVIGEIAVFIFEAIVLKMFSHELLSWKNALLLSLLMNLVSLLLGDSLVPFLAILHSILFS